MADSLPTPRFLQQSNRPRFLQSKTGIVLTLWLILVVAAMMMRPFASAPTTGGAANRPMMANNAANNRPVNNAPANNAPANNAPVPNRPVNNAPANVGASAPPPFHSPPTPPLGSPLLSVSRKATTGNNWPGWDAISHMFVFGDSWTTTRFDPRLEQPSEKNPFGNPPWPGNSSSAGPGWAAFLTGTYNGTFMKTANIARGASTTDDQIMPPYLPIGQSFRQQVYNWWWPRYAKQEGPMDWKSDKTIFSLWMGLNDVLGMVGGDRNATPTLQPVIDSYGAMCGDMYKTGARNFLFLNVPPHEKSPISVLMKDVAQRNFFALQWNEMLDKMALNFSDTHPEASVFVFDAHTHENQILADPCSYEITCSLKVTDRACKAYEGFNTPSDIYDPSCNVPIGQYFWKDRVHPTFTVMNETARAIVEELRKV